MQELDRERTFVEDQWIIDFKDTREFLIENWRSSVEQYRLSSHDLKQAEHCVTDKALRTYLEKQIIESRRARQFSKAAAFSNVLPFGKSIWQLESCIQELLVSEEGDESNGGLVDVKQIDTSPLWAFAYLNLQLTADSPRKLKVTTGWMNGLRRSIELLNSAIASFRQLENGDNTIRTELVDTFEPLLSIFHKDEFVQKWTRYLDGPIKAKIASISETTKHIRDINETSKLDRESVSQKYVTNFGLRDRILPPDGTEKAIFPVDNLPKFRSDVFIGRQEDITKIHEELGDREPGKIRKYHIYGRRGIGKTQIALEYARRHNRAYDAVFWIQCETKASLKQSFADIAVKLELVTPEQNTNFLENLQRTIAWLRATSKKWLLVYDNAERNNLLTGYWPLSGTGALLLTSRSYFNFFEDEGRSGQTVECFNHKEREELFMTLLGSKWQTEHLGDGKMMSQIEEAAIRTLLDKTGGLPITIYHSANLILDLDINPTQTVRHFMEGFEKAFDALPARAAAPRDHLIRALDTVWSISFANLSPNARVILNCLSLLAPDSILVDLFFPKDPLKLTAALDFCRAAGMARPGRGENTIQTVINPSSELQAALDELKTKGLIRVIGREISIHRTVQEAVSLKDDELRACFDAMTSLLYDVFPQQHQGRPLYLFEIGEYDECLNLVAIARSAVTDQSSLLFSHLLNTEGVTYYELNMLGPSRLAMEQCLEIRRSELGDDHPEVAISLGNLGNIELAEGNHEVAFECLGEAASIREAMGDEAAVMLGVNYMQIGHVKAQIDDDTAAYAMYQKSEGVLNKYPNDLYRAYLDLAYGNLELKKGEFSTAAQSFEKARVRARQDNNWHPLVAAANYKLGCAEFEMDNHKKSMKYLNNALDIAEVRSPSNIDGTIARIQWKMSEVLLDETAGEYNEQGIQLKEEMEFRQKEIAEHLGVDLRGMDEWPDREKSFDLLVPGYFR
ncbi:hypothetical protein DV736_g4887, partial [Chaetothyriales sp. CBS 134916]